jgi:phosphinothricin acetyltransferase
MLIRDADSHRDAAACAAIYTPYVEDTAISFEEHAPTTPEFALRIEQTTKTHPWLVAEHEHEHEHEHEVIGYAYATRHRERASYRWATDVAVYVAGAHQRRGAGRALYEALLGLLAQQGFRIACAGITLPNAASVALHEALGFQLVGVYKNIGWKRGAWHDVGWWQLELAPTSSQADASERDPPREPGPPVRLRR